MLHVGVIGCGGMGRSHIDRLTNRTQGAEVVAVADMVDALVEKGAAIAGPNCKKYKSEADLINDPAVDAVFIVTPGFDPELVAYCQQKGLPVYPGCTTPTDYHAALKFGLEVLKFFPAEQSGGLSKIKAMSAPFPMFRVMPTGGISLKNLKEYLSCPVVAACGGSYMVAAELIDGQRWNEITELCRKSVEIAKEARSHG